MIFSPGESILMRATHAPTLRDLHLGLFAPAPRGVPSRAQTYAWIDEDPDLAPAKRREVRLDAFA